MADELQELREHAEHGAHDGGLAPVTLTMAVFAVLVAALSLLGHRAHTEELLLQTKATDQWAYYQAKDIRRRGDETFLDELAVLAPPKSASAAKLKEKYSADVARYKQEQDDIKAEAKNAEEEVKTEQRRGDRFDLGEVLLEAALVICSITLMTRNRAFWRLGMAAGTVAVAIAATGLLIQ